MSPSFGKPGPSLRLGLIGDNIADSRAPILHRLAGGLVGIDVSYDLFVPRELGLDFDALLAHCRDAGLRGLNITYPYKQRVIANISGGDALLRRIGAANTIVFADGAVAGHNTDHSGFIAAYRAAFAERQPGAVAQIGAGGVGRAVAFGLVTLGASEIRLIETDAARARALATVLAEISAVPVSVHEDISACAGAEAVINCTPIGMVGYPGTPVPAELLAGIGWAFDAVYTPVETTFKQDAEAAGAQFLSGFELFFHQGVDAFEIFAGCTPPDLAALRRSLVNAAPIAA